MNDFFYSFFIAYQQGLYKVLFWSKLEQRLEETNSTTIVWSPCAATCSIVIYKQNGVSLMYKQIYDRAILFDHSTFTSTSWLLKYKLLNTMNRLSMLVFFISFNKGNSMLCSSSLLLAIIQNKKKENKENDDLLRWEGGVYINLCTNKVQ